MSNGLAEATIISPRRVASTWTGAGGEQQSGRWSSAAQIESLARQITVDRDVSPILGPERENTFVASATPHDAVASAPVNNIIDYPRFNETQARSFASIVLKEWEGSIAVISADAISADLVTIRGGEHAHESLTAEIPWEEIADADRDLARPGALFRLSVGYQVDKGTRTRFSRIVFRRLPAWTKREIEDADALALDQFGAISVE